MRKPAQVLYTIDDYVRDGILREAHAQVLREADRPTTEYRRRGRHWLAARRR